MSTELDEELHDIRSALRFCSSSLSFYCLKSIFSCNSRSIVAIELSPLGCLVELYF